MALLQKISVEGWRAAGRIWSWCPSGWLLALVVAGTVALRLVPIYVPIADAWADRLLHDQVANQIVQQARAKPPAPAALEVEVARWMREHTDYVEPLRAQTRERFRESITFQGDDGVRHVFLGGDDGYYWLKLAASVLAHGTVCDRTENGTCIDALADAPLGQAIEYTESPHVYAIAELHRLMTWLRPGYPLSSSAVLVTVLVSAFMVIPAFLLARRLSNPLGGFVAALAVSANSIVIERTVDADDDVWILALPILTIYLLVVAFGRQRWPFRSVLAAVAGGSLAILAAVWKGWPLFGLLALAGLIVIAAWDFLGRVGGRRPSSVLAANAVVCAISAAIGFALVGWALHIQFDSGLIVGQLSGLFGHPVGPDKPLNTAPFPDTFQFVAELAAVNASVIEDSLGLVGLGLGVLGFALPLLAPGAREFLYALALAALAIACAAALSHAGAGRTVTLGIVGVLAVAAGVAGWLRKTAPEPQLAAGAMLGFAWLGATLWQSFGGVRYVLLAVPPLSIAAGIAVGCIASAAIAFRAPRWRPGRTLSLSLAGALAAAVVIPVAAGGVRKAYSHYPSVNSAWATVFSAIRAQSAPDAIVDTWWDYGHWAKYLTGRAVNLDGASLRNREVHWMARALAAPTDIATLGFLRMMNCGAVSDPSGEAPARAYETLVRWTGDRALAYGAILKLAQLPPEQAAGALRGSGLSDERVTALLKGTDCTPPESYLVLTTGMLRLRGWQVSGLWDPNLAYAVDLARRSPADVAEQTIERRLGVPGPAAHALYLAAKNVHGEEGRIAFAAPGAQTWSTDWQSCAAEAERLHCPLDLGDFRIGAHLQDLSVDLHDPQRTRIRVRARAGAEPTEAIPSLVEIARPDRLQDVAVADATVDLAVLVDPEQGRVFVGTPGVVRSTLVRLALLDGRYSPGFRKIADELGVDRRRVTAWRIVWEQP
jgi:Oligosaccharyl transferase STT3 subunit